ncbi:rRNA biogenesis protein rrp36 [Drosophila novamexicana]|uniref:rRNA biogenesis protein rrp36 n=1 Tax=Drosophila novamexicana TaxID=47314 RepID=UPI0011E5A8D1|nr:rRNA biogenesis protein rrp36 [Drosophila novamexicana]
MLSNKFLIMSFALFAVIFAVSAESSEEKISDRRFRWEGSNDQQEEADEEDGADGDIEADEDGDDAAQDDDTDDDEIVLEEIAESDNDSSQNDA